MARATAASTSGGAPTDVSYSYNALNQLLTAGSQSITHDANGNLTGDGTTSYSYDALNRLTGVNSTVALSYDAAGRLHTVTASTSTTTLYSGDELVAGYSGTPLIRI